MLTELRLQNFKAYRDTGRIRLRPLTILIGANNAGKSAVLDSLLLLKQTYEDKDPAPALVTTGPYVDLGGFHDILWGGRSASPRTVRVSLAVALSEADRYQLSKGRRPYVLPVANQINASFSFDSRKNTINVSSVQLSRSGRTVLRVSRRGANWQVPNLPERVYKSAGVEFLNFLPQVVPRGRRPTDSRVVEGITQLVLTSQAQVHMWMHVFDDIHHVAPLRAPIPRYSLLGEMPASEAGTGGENLLRALQSRANVRGKKRPLLDLTDEWLASRLGMVRKVRYKNLDPQGTVKALLADENRGFSGINVANMGQGISQLLPILAAVITTGQDETLLVEQPEIHLHPAAQADLGDLFVDSLGSDRQRQFIVETHSEHLLLRIRSHVAEGTLSPKDFALLVVERSGQESRIIQLEPNKRGHFDWPRGFFEQGYQEALRLAEAASSKRAK